MVRKRWFVDTQKGSKCDNVPQRPAEHTCQGGPRSTTGVKQGGERAQDGEGEYLRHTECNVFKIVTQIVLLVRFEGSSPTILKGK